MLHAQVPIGGNRVLGEMQGAPVLPRPRHAAASERLARPPQRSGPAAAGAMLRSLLSEHAPYRVRWQRWASRCGREGPNLAAVAQTLAQHLWDAGERPETDRTLPRRLKDRVGRALNGEVLTWETLTWFIDAFAMSPAHAAALRATLTGAQRPAATLPGEHGTALHRTRSLHELRTLGPDGRPVLHRTIAVIEALVDGLDRYPCVHDPAALELVPLRGGRRGRPHAGPDGLLRTDLHLPSPLARGATASLEYVTTFAHDAPAVPRYVRTAHSPVDTLEIRVEFSPARLPRQLHWAVWSAPAEAPGTTTPSSVDADCSTHRYLASVPFTAAGFVWAW